MPDKSKMVRFFGPGRLSSSISREAYASDASIYRVHPERVFCPSTEDEAILIIKDALKAGISITPRGGGTGLAGGALGTGYVIDASRLTGINHISTEHKTVNCQPGIIYRDLNLVLKESGLFFPPDPSSGDSCQIGGMLANNSSGPRSVKYGLTSDYVEELTAIGKDGKRLALRKLELKDQSLKDLFYRHPEYGKLLKLIRDNRKLILENWPEVKKNSAGYNLRQVIRDLDKGFFNLPALYVGSEGTLGMFLNATLRLLPIPEGNRSFRLFFNALEDAGDAVPYLLDTEPSALEIVDGSSLDLIGRDKHAIPPQAEAMLMVEYDDDLDRREEMLDGITGKLRLSVPPEKAADEKQRSALWAARKAIVPILYRHHSTRRPLPLIEDASLPVDRLTEYISWIKNRLEREDVTFGLFGHIGDGNLHVRPLLDLSTESDYELARSLYDEAYEKMFDLGGSSTAEHADGRLRAPVLRRLYGEEIYRIFEGIKTILDPQNLFNPEVILSRRAAVDDLDLTKLELTCAACGKCNGYCPAFEIFRREDMSPRGWLRMLKFEGKEQTALNDFYKYCLNCKNCTTVCPAGVDIAGDILSYKAAHPDKTAGKVISLFDRQNQFTRLLKTGSVLYPLSRTFIGRKLTALAGRPKLGLDDRAVFPRPARKTLRERYPELCTGTSGVALFHGCADNYFDSAAGDAIVRVFRHYEWKLALPPQHCCGLPMEVYGHRDNMIAKAKYNLNQLENYEAVVLTCASCLHRLADYPELFKEGSAYHQKAQAVKKKLFDISQYLKLQQIELPHIGAGQSIRLSYHHPCHLRAAGLEDEPIRLLADIDGIEVIHPERAGRCCGQAGSFGFFHYQEGMAMFTAKKEEYRRLAPEIIVSSCPSCVSKIRKEMGEGIRVCHPIEIIADLIEGKRLEGSKR
jgi:FAD/FMN-containing dehydrogenase/Fe-S oxidoreductase